MQSLLVLLGGGSQKSASRKRACAPATMWAWRSLVLALFVVADDEEDPDSHYAR